VGTPASYTKENWHKYHAKKTWVDNICFRSKLEADRYVQLKLQQAAGLISNLSLQPRFRIEINGIKICDYIADFMYQEGRNPKAPIIVEDAKGQILPVFRIKWKMVHAIYGDRYTFRIWPEKKRLKSKVKYPLP
jgi:hypothetical protein